jgi:aminoglycoside 6'-N-acetyltransferase I
MPYRANRDASSGTRLQLCWRRKGFVVRNVEHLRDAGLLSRRRRFTVPSTKRWVVAPIIRLIQLTLAMQASDRAQLLAFARGLWRNEKKHELKGEHVFVFERHDGALPGFAWVSVRPFVNGDDLAPCPHAEGWYVEPQSRGQGVGRGPHIRDRELVRRPELCRTHFGGLRARSAIGCEPTEQVQYFRKPLSTRR